MPHLEWTCTETPLGSVYLAVSGEGLIRSTLPGAPDDPFWEDLRLQTEGGAYCRGRCLTQPYVEWVARYFAGDLTVEIPALAPAGSRFQRQIWEVTQQIPPGDVLSYGELACRAGSPRAARAAGSAMARNPIPLFVPCHRVVRSDGSLGGFGGGLPLKVKLLKHEGFRWERRAR